MDSLEEMVRRLAYQLWENAGCPAGRGDDFWFAAEAQIRQALDASAADEAAATDVAPPTDDADAARSSKAA
jgi:hypothetical protein